MQSPHAQRSRVLIGISPRILRDVPAQLGFRGKTLQYLEQSVAHWLMGCGAMVVMIPTVEQQSAIRRSDLSVHDYAATLDGLILQGGADIDPSLYGEQMSAAVGPIDRARDRFELDLLRAFAKYGKPVFGICRGMQLINVAYGGTLHHDLNVAGATSFVHCIREQYDEHQHDLTFEQNGWLQSLYAGVINPRVNSIHHQGVNKLGTGLIVEAWSGDGVIECVRHEGPTFMVGVQWHPEFHDERFPELLPTVPLLNAFIDAARKQESRRDGAQAQP
ncbi:MAG TPA: type 1 glutamine amidotransferase [Steroidobacteraceae bacterium]|nr:type 1 glutamine amidotransferase [Steroidobacteraceae bacterium]